MYLSLLTLNHSRLAVLWVANPYRVHQRLCMGCEKDPRLLFRIEAEPDCTQILVQSHTHPKWDQAFSDFPALAGAPQVKEFALDLLAGEHYRFRLLANPTIKKTVEGKVDESRKIRLGILREPDQIAWLQRKLEAAGARLLGCQAARQGFQYARKNPSKDENRQTYLGVRFDGLLVALEPEKLKFAVERGVGSAKGYGFGLLSLGRG